jgi:enamine deaminase RidA (YjgF/YER057c/UK114 family)
MRYIKPGARMSAAVVAGGFVWTAGQVDDSQSDVAGQTRAILAKIDGLLAEAGTDKSHVISANVWLADIAGFAELNAVWDAWIDPQRPPARATVESRLAGPQYKVEIAVVAAVPSAT